MKSMLKNLLVSIGLMSSVSFVISSNALAIDCYTDCNDKCKICTRIPGLGRKCVTEPSCYAACESTKQSWCQVLEPLKDGILHGVANAIANDANIRSQTSGWDMNACLVSGFGAIAGVTAAYSVPICVAFNAASAGCAVFVSSSMGSIHTLTCAALCETKNLNGCR